MLDDSLLFPVFDELRRQGVPVGISEYLLAVETVRDGYSCTTPRELKRLCGLLWAKSQEDLELLDGIFSAYVESRLEQASIAIEPESPDDKPDDERDELRPDSSDTQISSEAQKPPPSQTQMESLSRTTVEYEKKRHLRARPSVFGHAVSVDELDGISGYHFIPKLPLSKRDMAGCWRQFRRFGRSGPPRDLDVEGTIREICRSGLFLRPVLQPRRRNQAGLLLLIDQQGSMAAFSFITEALAESIHRGGMLGRVRTWYFHDCPEDFLYARENLLQPLPVEEVLAHHAKDNSVLIISDAGAARRDYDSVRIEKTARFIGLLNCYSYRHAWLNPVPESRWMRSSAAEISRHIAMFPLDWNGLHDAINILRGQPGNGG